MQDAFEIKLFDEISGIKETLARNTAILEVNTSQLAEHMKRTALLEERLTSERKDIDEKLQEALLPIKLSRAAGRIITLLMGALSLFFGIYKLICMLIRR